MTWWHRVGQRVRKIAHPNLRGVKTTIPVGAEGVIAFIGTGLSAKGTCLCGCGQNFCPRPGTQVVIDYGILHEGCRWFCSVWHCLEPILPEGQKVVSWEDCLWNPSYLKETTEI